MTRRRVRTSHRMVWCLPDDKGRQGELLMPDYIVYSVAGTGIFSSWVRIRKTAPTMSAQTRGSAPTRPSELQRSANRLRILCTERVVHCCVCGAGDPRKTATTEIVPSRLRATYRPSIARRVIALRTCLTDRFGWTCSDERASDSQSSQPSLEPRPLRHGCELPSPHLWFRTPASPTCTRWP